MDKNKARAGTRAGAICLADQAERQQQTHPHHSTKPTPVSSTTLDYRLAELQNQAERLMATDVPRYAQHWAIWASLQFKRCGWPWAGGRK